MKRDFGRAVKRFYFLLLTFYFLSVYHQDYCNHILIVLDIRFCIDH